MNTLNEQYRKYFQTEIDYVFHEKIIESNEIMDFTQGKKCGREQRNLFLDHNNGEIQSKFPQNDKFNNIEVYQIYDKVHTCSYKIIHSSVFICLYLGPIEE